MVGECDESRSTQKPTVASSGFALPDRTSIRASANRSCTSPRKEWWSTVRFLVCLSRLRNMLEKGAYLEHGLGEEAIHPGIQALVPILV